VTQVWLVIQEAERPDLGTPDRWPDSIWTSEAAARERERELRELPRTAEVDVVRMDLDTPDGTVDPIDGRSGVGWSG
jgi:hypothetical protein